MRRVTIGTVLRFLVPALVLGLGACRGRDTAPTPESAEQRSGPAGQPGETPAGAPETEPEATAGGEALPETEPVPEPAPAPPRPTSAPPPASAPAPTPSPPAVPETPPAPAPTPQAEPDEPASPPPPPEPEIVEVTIPEGTVLELELLTALDSSVNRVGDEIQARTLAPVHVKGEPVLPRGTYVEGHVTEVRASGRVKGVAQLGFTFERLSTRAGVKSIKTSYVEKVADSSKGKDAKVIGGAAGIGAVVGGIIGGKKGAAIGAAIGGAGGTGVVLSTKGEEIRLPVGTEVNVRLDEPVVVQLN